MPYKDTEKNKIYHRHKAQEFYFKTDKGRLSSYRCSAKSRGIDFGLSDSEFGILLHSPCHYCGLSESMGIDRKNSAVGYFSNNVVPCCKVCNYMKSSHNYIDFLTHIKKISDHLNK